MKAKFTLITLFIAISTILGHAQSTWSSNLAGNGTAANTNGTVSITSSLQSVDGGNPQFIKYNNFSAVTVNDYSGNYNGVDIDGINLDLSSIPLDKRLRAKAGVPFSITINTSKRKQGTNTDLDNVRLKYGIGKNEQSYRYDIAESNGVYGTYTSQADPITQSFTINHTFVGRTEAWIVLELYEGALIFSFTGGFGGNFNTTAYSASTSIVIPIVVEGPSIEISEASPIQPLGTFREPAIPQMILHNPPGDGSSVTFATNQETCRNISETIANENAVNANLKVTLGIAGQAGMFITAPFEFSASISSDVGTGSSEVKTNGRQNCLSILSAISTQPGIAPANEGSIYIGYSSTMAYGVYPTVTISETSPFTVVKETIPIFAFVRGSAVPFYYSKSQILEQIQKMQAIADTATIARVEKEALYQMDIWKQVLEKDSININNPANVVLVNTFDLTGGAPEISNSTTLSVSTNDSYDVSHFIEAGVGASFTLMFGGSGVEGGVNFKTKKTLGQSVSNSNNSSTSISYNLLDNDGNPIIPGSSDVFKIKIVKDPTYGTPIFLVDSANSKTSCPYEGGRKRDQPKLEINGSTLPNITVSNVSLGNSGNFKVKICNNSAEVRDYGFGFVNESVMSDVFISSTAGTGSSPFGENITKLGLITAIPPNGGCKTTVYDVNVARRFANSPMSYPNIEFVTFAECEPEIRSSIFATVNFATPPPPTNVGASAKEVCAGTVIQLTGNCPVGVPTWYDDPTGGLELGTGATLSVTPAANTNYYLGCVANLYNRDRVGTGEIFVTTPFPTLNLTSDLSFNALQIANTTLTANNKINDPARVTYKAGNSLTFSPGFEAKSGSTFTAEIGGCGN
jgi:hypothetical protein